MTGISPHPTLPMGERGRVRGVFEFRVIGIPACGRQVFEICHLTFGIELKTWSHRLVA
jgi:hypothetical protein